MGGNGLAGLFAALLIAEMLLDPQVKRRTKCIVVLAAAAVVVIALLLLKL